MTYACLIRSGFGCSNKCCNIAIRFDSKMYIFCTLFSAQVARTTFTIVYANLCHIAIHIPYHNIDTRSGGETTWGRRKVHTWNGHCNFTRGKRLLEEMEEEINSSLCFTTCLLFFKIWNYVIRCHHSYMNLLILPVMWPKKIFPGNGPQKNNSGLQGIACTLKDITSVWLKLSKPDFHHDVCLPMNIICWDS